MPFPPTKYCPECHNTIKAHPLCGGTAIYDAGGGNTMECDCPGHLGQANLDDHARGCSKRHVKYAEIDQ